MENLLQADPQKIEEAISFRRAFSSVILSTVTDTADPHASYAPYISHQGHFYVFVSGLAQHAQTLYNGKASLFFIEDEAQAKNLYARRRLTLDCSTSVIDRKTQTHEPLLDMMEAAHGSTVKLLRSLPDFVLFELSPVEARFVTGFGAAYDLTDALGSLTE